LPYDVAQRVHAATHVYAPKIKGVRVAEVCRTGAGIQPSAPMDDWRVTVRRKRMAQGAPRTSTHGCFARSLPVCRAPAPCRGLWAVAPAACTCACSRRVPRLHGTARQPTPPQPTAPAEARVAGAGPQGTTTPGTP